MEYIYKISISVYNNLYRIRREKFRAKEANSIYLVDGGSRRIKKSKIGLIEEDIVTNGLDFIRFISWVIDEKDIVLIENNLINKVKETLESYSSKLSDLKKSFDTEPTIEIKDRTE